MSKTSAQLKSEGLTLYSDALQILQQQAQAFLLKQTQNVSSQENLVIEKVKLENAIGRVLSENVYAKEELPSFDNSTMDGFCVNSEYVNGQLAKGPVHLSVVASLAAGDDLSNLKDLRLTPDSAIEIMTGAMFPTGKDFGQFDSVIKIEEVKTIKNDSGEVIQIEISHPVKSHDNVRLCGEDFKKDQLILSKGRKILTQHLLALAGLGVYEVFVEKPIEIAIASTGKELVSYNAAQLTSGKIRNSTALYLEKWFEEKNYTTKNYGIIDDQEDDYQKILEKAFSAGADIFVSTGAVSQGKFDFVRPVLEKMGATVHFHKCAIRPGKPILFASLDYEGQTRFIFGVPGNPVSTAVGARFFIFPFLQQLQGGPESLGDLGLHQFWAELSEDFKKPEGLRCFFKAQLYEQSTAQLHEQSAAQIYQESLRQQRGLKVKALSGQASFRVQPLIESNSWVVFPEENNIVKKGTWVEVYSL